ncbi:hypothetical protein PIB30_011833 [Stylosanthes scabra]|uniref:Uncharacterized protein n=1 Tax=Stylosanthes scabra TaxID=79078 RepID=A0ABU6S5J0_9FABA|nr:hypothetical protein [Stylosanthes scabra]
MSGESPHLGVVLARFWHDSEAWTTPGPCWGVIWAWFGAWPIVGSNEPINITQESVASARNTKQKLSQINEGNETRMSHSETRMFDSFDIVSLGKEDSCNVVVDDPVVMPSQPPHIEKE